MASIRVATLNVRSFRSKVKQKMIYELMFSKGFDVILLQETHFYVYDHIYGFNKDFRLPSWFSLGKRGARGVGIVFHPRLQYELIRFEHDTEGQFLSVEVKIRGCKVNFISLYFPNFVSPRRELFAKFGRLYNGIGGITVVGGDFNIELPENDSTDRDVPPSQRDFNKFLKDHDFFNVWELFPEEERRYSRIHYNGTPSTIDHLLISSGYKRRVNNVQRYENYINMPHRCVFSDHNPISFDLELNSEIIRKSPYWKMNTKLIQSKEYGDKIKKMMEKEIKKIKSFKEWEKKKTYNGNSQVSQRRQ